MERDFKGVWIPKEIWLDDRLTALEKVILIEIDSLDTEERHCYASNRYLAEFCQCTEIKISNAVKKCIELGYLELVSFDGRTRILKSRLKESLRQTYKNIKADLNKVEAINKDNKLDTNESKKESEKQDLENLGVEVQGVENQGQLNTDIQNKEKQNKEKNNKRFVPPTLEEIEQFCKERGNGVDAKRVFDYYSSANWKDGRGNPVRNWKQKIIAVWEKPKEESKVGKVAHEREVYDKDFNEDGTFRW